MASVDTGRWGWFERRTAALFHLAGASLLIVLTVTTFEQATGTAIPDIAYWPLFPFGVAIALAGLVGLYPRLAERAPSAAKIGTGLAIAGVVVLLGGLAVLLATAPSGSYPASLGPIGAPFLLGLFVFVLAFGAYGIGGLRTPPASRGADTLLLGVALVQLLELAGALVVFPAAGARASGQPGWYLVFEVVTYGVIIAALFGIGYALQRGATAPEADERTHDHVAM